MFFPLLFSVAFGQECNTANNAPFINVNPDCNYVGACRFNRCRCCSLDPKTLLPDDINGWVKCPGWRGGEYVDDPQNSGAGGQCAHQNLYSSVQFRMYSAADITCGDTAKIDNVMAKFTEFYTARGYDGKLVVEECKECSPTEPCEFCPSDGGACDNYETGVELNLGTDFHTFYSMGCENTDIPVPITFGDSCPDNYDKGYLAYLTYARAQTYVEGADPKDWDAEGADFTYVNTELGTDISAASYFYWVSQDKEPELNPPNICEARGITNVRSDMKLLGLADDCRAGISPEWKGGQSCDSPYITCLPKENTPEQSPKDPFYTDTHRYTIDQCTAECTFDQRCLGYEFVADAGTNVGDCNLIDDIPMQMTNPISSSVTIINPNLSDLSNLGAPAICVHKTDYCNPFFQVSDLDEDLIKCYCPNNRKGFYTKKVKRAVENYVFCGGDDDVTERIKLAAANRMFHLCENWCLFNVFEPERESWYWNPWKKCFREQYAGTGMHRSYCNRVITNPTDPGSMKTIEQYFINTRKDSFCQPGENGANFNTQTFPPTGAPTDFTGQTTWYLAAEEESCDDACEALGTICDEATTNSISSGSSEEEIRVAFAEAGFTCRKYGVAPPNWAAPVARAQGMNKCMYRNVKTEDNKGCQWATGVGLQRLCACVNTPSD